MNADKASAGHMIRQYRVRMRLSREELSKMSGVPWQTIRNWEVYGKEPGVIAYLKVARVLEIPTETVFDLLED